MRSIRALFGPKASGVLASDLGVVTDAELEEALSQPFFGVTPKAYGSDGA